MQAFDQWGIWFRRFFLLGAGAACESSSSCVVLMLSDAGEDWHRRRRIGPLTLWTSTTYQREKQAAMCNSNQLGGSP